MAVSTDSPLGEKPLYDGQRLVVALHCRLVDGGWDGSTVVHGSHLQCAIKEPVWRVRACGFRFS
jgi:hypothetical protein